jgi:hypothetical protein
MVSVELSPASYSATASSLRLSAGSASPATARALTRVGARPIASRASARARSVWPAPRSASAISARAIADASGIWKRQYFATPSAGRQERSLSASVRVSVHTTQGSLGNVTHRS